MLFTVLEYENFLPLHFVIKNLEILWINALKRRKTGEKMTQSKQRNVENIPAFFTDERANKLLA